MLKASFGMSIDGYSAGPDQSIDDPLGRGGNALFEWMFKTRTIRERLGQNGGETGIDNDFVARGFDNIGAWIIGRNMFGPVRGSWPDETWRGWWGDNPPFHTHVLVLTHFEREPIIMGGGTIFYFVTDGIEAALRQAKAAACGKDIRLGGGAATMQQFLKARLVDELHVAISPTILGSGEAPFNGIDLSQLGYCCRNCTPGENATHMVLTKS